MERGGEAGSEVSGVIGEGGLDEVAGEVGGGVEEEDHPERDVFDEVAAEAAACGRPRWRTRSTSRRRWHSALPCAGYSRQDKMVTRWLQDVTRLYKRENI